MRRTDMTRINVLCVAKNSNYKLLAKSCNLNLYDESRDAYKFTGSGLVIAHPPCAQWSKLKGLSNRDKQQKELANFCLDKVIANGGIFEHPAGSEFFKYRGIKPQSELNQLWFGFPARKATWLYFHDCEPMRVCFSPTVAARQVNNMNSESRSIMPVRFCMYLIECVKGRDSRRLRVFTI